MYHKPTSVADGQAPLGLIAPHCHQDQEYFHNLGGQGEKEEQERGKKKKTYIE